MEWVGYSLYIFPKMQDKFGYMQDCILPQNSPYVRYILCINLT